MGALSLLGTGTVTGVSRRVIARALLPTFEAVPGMLHTSHGHMINQMQSSYNLLILYL